MPNPPTLGQPSQSGEPRISHDPLSINEVLVWERMDTNANAFVRPAYLDPYAGYVDRAIGVTLYAGFLCVNIRELDRQFIEVCYRKLPSQIFYSWPSFSDLPPIPDTLTGITVTYNSSAGAGSSSHPASQQSAEITNAGSVAENPRGKAQASASIIPEVQFTYKPVWTKGVATMNYVFQMASNVGQSDILARTTSILIGTGAITATVVTVSIATPGVITWTAHGLTNGRTVMFSTTGALPTGLLPGVIYYIVASSTNTIQVSLTPFGTAINTSGTQSGVHSAVAAVNPWPVFKPQNITLSAFGSQVSVAVDAETNAYYSRNDDGSSQSLGFDWGNGNSSDVSVTNRTYQIPPSLHPSITVANATGTSSSVTATIDASSAAIVQGGTTIIGAISNTKSESAQAAGSVSPSSIAATIPPGIMTTGLYLTDENSSPHGDQLLFVHVSVVDFSLFA